MPKNNGYAAKDIEVLEGLLPVRKRPGMYIGNTNQEGLHHLVNEILDNSIDEVVAGYAKNINFHYSKDKSITINDEVDQFGNFGPIIVDQSKEERDAKVAKKYLGNVRVVWSNGTFPEAPKQGAPAPALKAAAVKVEDDLPF